MRQNSMIHRLGHENHGLKLKSYELMHQIAFLQKQIANMQKTYHTHYTNHANTVAHLQQKNAELNKALVIHTKPSLFNDKSLDLYERDGDHWRHRHRHHHHRVVDDGFYDNGDRLIDEDGSLGSTPSEIHVPLLPIPQHQYSFATPSSQSVEMDHPEHPPQEPPHPIHPPFIPPPGPLPPTMQSYIPQKKRMALVL